MMFCLGCGKQIPDDSAFCGGCGKSRDAGSNKRTDWRWMVGLGLLIACGMTFLVGNRNPSVDAQVPPPVTLTPLRARPSPVLTEHTVPLFSGEVVISARRMMYKCFAVGPTLQNPTVSGSFQAGGGFDNDIQFVVATEPEFTAWRLNGGGSLLFDTGRMTGGPVEAQLATPGRYCAAFSNVFALVMGKRVNSTVVLRYSTWDTPAN